MSQTPQTINIVNNNGSLNYDFSGNFDCINSNYTINSSGSYICDITNNVTTQTRYGELNIIADIGVITLDSRANTANSIIIKASHVNGGIMALTGGGGYDVISSSGNISLLSQGANINIGVSSSNTIPNMQTQNINIESFNTMNMSSSDIYFVSSDVISFISNTGDIQFGTSANANSTPVIKFNNDNVLINQSDSNLDYQLDIAITQESDNNNGYNGIIINSKVPNVASDLTLQTSNTLGDGTQCILSLGSFGSNNPHAIYQTYLAYQTSNIVIRLDGPSYSANPSNSNSNGYSGSNESSFGTEFTYSDIGRNIYWPSSNRQDTITNLGTYITSTSDTANISVSGPYTGTISRVYLIQIDNITTPNTFMWSNNGGTQFQQQFIPIVSTPIILDNGLSITFTATTGFTIKQQFTFQTKITALVTTTLSTDNTPEEIYTLQQFYSYINTTTPSDIVIKTNSNEKLRITADGSISIQKQLPTACLDLNSNYNKVMIVNQTIKGYQVNPNISYISSGGYILVWNSQDNTQNSTSTPIHFDVYGQRYLTDGMPYGSNFKINNTITLNQVYPSVAGNRIKNSNHFIVVWSSLNDDNLYKVYCQIYHNNLPIRAFDIQIDNTNPTTSNQVFPRVAGLFNGNYIITWNADDTSSGNGNGIYSVKGIIIDDNATFVSAKLNISNPLNTTNATFSYVIGLADNDISVPNGFVVGYMVAVDTTIDPRYTISLRVMNSNGTPYSNEIPITLAGSSSVSSISDGLVSLAELNLKQVNSTYGNGGFIITFYRNYQADTTLYQEGDNVTGLLSGATSTISVISPPINGVKIITLQNVSNRLLISEELSIASSVPDVGTIIEKIANVDFLTTTTANITLDIGNKNIVAYRFNSNLTNTNDAIWSKQINTTSLYADTERITGIGNNSIFKYKRPISEISVDNLGTACITWSNGSIPSVYYQLINVDNGTLINKEQRILSQYDGLKQRDQVVSHLQSIEGNNYGFVISWDNQCLDIYNTGIYQQLIGYRHSLINLEDGNSNFSFNHQNQCGIGTNTPIANLHIHSQATTEYNDPPNTTSIIIQNTSKHIITNTDDGLHNISFKNGNNKILNIIKSNNSLRYDDLYPLPENLIGFYKFDETQGTQAKDNSAASTFISNTTSIPIYVNTSAILINFDIEKCWTAGLINNSLLFNGNNNYLFIENTSPNNLNTVLETIRQLSISIWVKIPVNYIPGITYDIISNGGDYTIPGTYHLGLSDHNYTNTSSYGHISPFIYLTAKDTNSSTEVIINTINTAISSNITINDDSWHNITATIDARENNTNTIYTKLYVDGILHNTVDSSNCSINGVQHGTYKTYIGSRDGSSSSTSFYRGYMDELRIYNKLLTLDLILQLYDYGNPNITEKGALFINANNVNSHNLGIVLDDKGKLNNLNARPLPYSLLSGDLKAYNSNTTVSGIGTYFTTELTVGDILTFDIASAITTEFTVITISSNTSLTLDRQGYGGQEISKSYQSVLRRPSIFTFFDNGDTFKGNIDNYGNLIIGNGKASSMLEICGESNNTKNIPHLTLTNTTIESTQYARLTAINFNSNDMSSNMSNILNSHKTLGHIETSHDGTSVDNKGIMRFFTNNGTQENNIMSLSSSGYVGIGNQNEPLSIIHIKSIDTSNNCTLILESNYNNSSSSNSSIFDESSSISFAGLTSITETTSANINKKILSAIKGSNDSNSKILNGRLDLLTNNDDNAVKNGVESRMSITHTGNVGINIINPNNLLCVAPELRVANGTINIITTSTYDINTNITTFTISNNIFTDTDENKSLLIGGTFIIDNTTLTQGTILLILSQSQFTTSGDYTAWNTYKIYIHRPGLNVNKSGNTGINTKTMNSTLTVNGSVSTPIITITSNITLNDSHYTILCNTTAGSITITLPLNSNNNIRGRMYRIKNIGTNSVDISAGSGSTIDNTGSYNITGSYTYNTIQSDGFNWWIV